MEALQGSLPQIPNPQFEPNTDKIKRNLTNKGVHPTPKIVHTLRKKQIQKHNRKLNRLNEQDPPLSESQSQALSEETHFQTLKAEYRSFTRAVKSKNGGGELTVGMPWERVERIGFRELASSSGEYGGEKLKKEELNALREMFETRKREELKWVLDDDVEIKEEWFDGENRVWDPTKRRRGEGEVIQFLVERLSGTEFAMRDWKLSRMMKQSGLEFTEGQVLKVLNGLGAKKCWKQALSVVEWVYKDRGNKHCKSRFVYTKLLAILGKARRPQEALDIFNMMRGECHMYPDIAAYHSIAVTLGQTGRLKELLKVIECMRQKPVKIDRNMFRNWDPVLEPDVVVYNAILNACVQSHQWKSVYWVFNQLRKCGLKPNGATYGLAMEVMLQSGKYDLVHELFRKMKKSGEAPKALTYKVIVRALWCEGKVNEAVEAVRDMERRGVVGTSGVYYELACCLCKSGRWQDALLQVEKMKHVSNTKPLEVTFTGMIRSSMEGGHIDDCISIFEHMKNHCTPNIGTINTMLKVFGRTDMFSKAKELFEETKAAESDSDPSLEGGGSSLVPDEYTYTSMLKASASALQWEYFEYVYKEMALSGYKIDQSKNASILVEASRAGKGYLLEHAFDTTLEAGEIPHQLFFIEMVYQATARHDYKRAATLVNTMAYAPFQVSERQWTDVFEKNEDGISQDGLTKLLDALQHCDVTSEATLLNLKKSLQSLVSREFSNSMSVSSWDDNDEGFDDNEGLIMPNHSLEYIDGKPKPGTDPPDDSSDAPFSEFPHRNSTQRGVAADIETPCRPLDYISDEDGLDSTEIDEEIEALISKDDSHESHSPSPKEIMKDWKERRKKHGILMPFQLSQK
ncbi:pentatricopeptide repeat-containing protein At5g67570, chloroplastic isoform X1 [Rosa rugosa]|uniref:pentatricopeptide repeat-containing protein At5g67570, chloroplastic isoform X1 n=1 Tax=Rosa rugosa TaxID=74645 RepID=UPI002B41630B|nr:pentatricopeptide repeat-containing protein At5g67570, chloroplastic isoform X1 [Rosa rugosa]